MSILSTIKITDIKTIIPTVDDSQPWDFTLNWMIGKYCNYVCTYCDKSNRDKTSPHHSLETLKQFWTNSKNAALEKGFTKIRIIITGGEPTSNPNLLEFLKYLHKEKDTLKYLSVNFLTNISQSKEYYLEAIKYSSISFSTHFEYWNEEEAMDTILTCNKHGTTNVMLMMEEAYSNRVLAIEEILTKEGISKTVQRIRNTYMAKPINNKEYKIFDYEKWKLQNGKI
jgi:MoaA/NifB/PqqE/SkfB family radical SAM enzyme